MNKLIIARNSLDPETWEAFETENVCQFLLEEFGTWPDTARIYHEQVSEASDVTPSDENGIAKLSELEGTFYVIMYPGDPLTIIIAVVAVAAAAAAAFLLKPEIPLASTRANQISSPNNELSNRTNQARPNGRIPDIYGSVISIPDLVAPTYKVFENNIEIEYSYLCIGRGDYYIDPEEVWDDQTPISTIKDAKVEVYSPFTSPNSGDAPQLTIGGAINTPVKNVVPSTSVNGQVLKATNGNNLRSSKIRAVSPNRIELDSNANVDFRDLFEVGQSLNVLHLSDGSLSLSGAFIIDSVDEFLIEIIPTGNWLNPLFDGETIWQEAIVWVDSIYPVGPFILDSPTQNQVITNFVVAGGLYIDNGTSQTPYRVILRISVTPINNANMPIGATDTHNIEVNGFANNKSNVNVTDIYDLPFTGRCQITVERISSTLLDYSGTLSDEIVWRDLYSVSPIDNLDFGNVTTVQAVTVGNASALKIKERKLNARVTRKLPARISGSSFTTELFPTRRASDIISAILLDPVIGKRSISEVNFNNIYDTVDEIEEYFGTEIATQFDYTFDDESISLEETIGAIVTAIFSIAYRRGNVINISFEKETEDSTLLFNHRNKIPSSEVRSIKFGNQDNADGVELEYISPEDGATLTYYIPEDRSAINAKTLKTIGIQSKLHAYFHAWRAWNKIRFQNVAVEFQATQEADLLVLSDRVLVADNTRTGTIDGEIIAQNGLELTLSQKVDLGSEEFTIYLQHYDGTVEMLPITQGGSPDKVVLGSPPKAPLAVSFDLYARATFVIVGTIERTATPFLVTEKEPQSNFVISVSGVNYDNRYYSNDLDYINEIVDENGN